jgi:uncharacterized protein
MGKLVLLLVAVVVAVWWLRRALAKPRTEAPPAGGAGDGSGSLVSCAHCGLNLPRSEARSAGGHHFCSEEHWRAGPRKD